MAISFKEAADFLLSGDYILVVGPGKFKLSTKFHKEMASQSRVTAVGENFVSTPGEVMVLKSPEGTQQVIGNNIFTGRFYELSYKKFISDAQVPKRLENNRGESYPANNYSEPGMKAYRKALESGADYEILVKSTMLYYKSGIRFKKAIGNYMHEGIWKTGYDDLQSAASTGEQAVTDHIKTELDDGQQSSYRIG